MGSIMPKAINLDIAPTSKFSLNESHVLTGVQPDRLTRLIDEKAIPARASSTTKGTTKFNAVGLSVVKFLDIKPAHCNAELSKRTTNDFWRYASSNWHTLVMDPSNAPEFHSKDLELSERIKKKRIERLFRELTRAFMKLEWAKGKVVEDPNVRGGLPTIRGSRVSVYEIVDILKGDGMEICLETFIALNAKDIEAADIYAKAIPRQRIPGPGRGLMQLVKTGELRLLRTTRVYMPPIS